MNLTPALSQHYATVYRAIEPMSPAHWDRARVIAALIVRGRSRYEATLALIPEPWARRFPWWLVGILHYREDSSDFNREAFASNIANGQPWTQKTTIAPKGLGPYASFAEAAAHALAIKQSPEIRRFTWETVDQVAFWLERWNGFGHLLYHHDDISDYLVDGCTITNPGRYVADGVWDHKATGQQIGGLLICQALMAAGVMELRLPDVQAAAGAAALRVDSGRYEISRLQALLNCLPRYPDDPDTDRPLKTDGNAGPKTQKRFVEVFGRQMAGASINRAVA
jgi:lysozyme family protein